MSRRVRMPAKQSGVLLVAVAFLFGVALLFVVFGFAKGPENKAERDRRTMEVLAKARDALIARAAMNDQRPGSLPCPDQDNDGDSNPETVGGNCIAVLPGLPPYIGRFPYKTTTLEAEDYRDGYGERIWYVLSPSFRDVGSSISVAFPTSESLGELTLHGPTLVSNVVALLIAPGPVIQTQQRATFAQQTNAANYLEGLNAGGGPPINLDFELTLESATFNDRVLPITVDMIMHAVERRIAREAVDCLKRFALDTNNPSHLYPWASPVTDPNFVDASGLTFGRLPKSALASVAAIGPPSPIWPPASAACQGTGAFRYFEAWRKLIFYAVAAAYAPSPIGSCPGNCLTVNTAASVKATIIVAGKKFSSAPDQSARATNEFSATAQDYYLETAPSGVNNAAGGGTSLYARMAGTVPNYTPHFNDTTECIGETASSTCP